VPRGPQVYAGSMVRRSAPFALAYSLSLAVLVAAMLAAPRANASARHRSRCFPHGSRTIALNRSVRVYSMPEYVEGVRIESPGTHACLRHRGTTLALEPTPRKRPRHVLHHVTLAGAIVAFVDSQRYVGARCDVIEVIDVANRRRVLSVPNVGCGGKAPESAFATDLVVNEHGSVAWITQRLMRQTRGPAAIVGFEVHSATTSGSTALLDSGTDIMPGSLRLAPGGEVSWLDGGPTLYASLR
jgi:hypothetical protein